MVGYCRGPTSSKKLTRRTIGAALSDLVPLAHFAAHRGSVWDSFPCASMACSLGILVSPAQMHLLNLQRSATPHPSTSRVSARAPQWQAGVTFFQN